MTSLLEPRTVGLALIGSAVWWVLQLIFVITFYVVGQPFGALSDLSNGVAVLLIVPFVLLFHQQNQDSSLLSTVALIIGIAGIVSAAVASFLILFGAIDFQQSLPPIMAGFSGIGLWLLISLLLVRTHNPYPTGLTAWGIVTGLGLAAIGLFLAVGDFAQVFLGGSSSLWSNPIVYPAFVLVPIGYFSYPIWAILVGRLLLDGKVA